MSTSLPERPDLDQLRRQAKELRDAVRWADPVALRRFARYHPNNGQGPWSLAAAQLVIARELGFSSWPKLKAAVDAAAAGPDARDHAFVAASIEGRLKEAAALWQADRGIASRSLHAAVVLGDTDAVRARLAADPESALAVDDERGWPPLLYACYSGWHQIDPHREARLAEVVRLLLEAGASPNTNNGGFRNRYRSAMRGAVEVNNPDITRVLLDSGANPDDGRCIEQAAGQRDHRCLELLLSRGARTAGTWALGAAIYADDAKAVSLLLEAIRATTREMAPEATKGLADAAAANASHEVVGVLLAAGADPDVHDSDVGLSALRCAIRAGNEETAALLVRHGASDDSTDVDRLMGACRRADRVLARRLLAEHADLPDRLTDDDRAAMVGGAGSASSAAVELMLESGFSPHDRNGFGEQPLHTTAYLGNAAVVRVLLDAGADVDARDGRFGSTPLAFASVGSGERVGKPGDWIEAVRLLIQAGASRTDVWISGKPPSEEVMEILRQYGISLGEAADQQPEDETELPDSIGTGVIADIARPWVRSQHARPVDLAE